MGVRFSPRLTTPASPNLVWMSVPASMLVSWVFHTWNLIVDYSENPFEGLVNDMPTNALSRTIEIDLREMLRETELPESVGPTQSGGLF